MTTRTSWSKPWLTASDLQIDLERDFWSAGLAFQKGVEPGDVDPGQLAKGIEVEMEHTEDAEVAERIALDHLAEHPSYYDALEDMEEALRAGEYGED